MAYMGKKCIICEGEAKFNIKDTSDYYCGDCAAEQFSDVSMLVKVEDQVKKIKKLVEEHEEQISDEPLDEDAAAVDSEEDKEKK